MCPCRFEIGEKRFQLFHRVFGQFAVAGQLAAKDRKHRRDAVFAAIQIKHIIARHDARRRCLIVIERAHTGIGPYDVIGRNGLRSKYSFAAAQR